MRISKTVIPAAILLTLAAPAVHAQKSAKKKPAGSQTQAQKPQEAPRQVSATDTFTAMDADHDGKITRAEWKGNAIGFAMLDRNADGVLSGDELKPAAQAPAQDATADTFAKLDRNHDGRLSRAEWQGAAKDFDLRDRDHDGAVTQAEYLQPKQ
ncbi:MAG: EF-hand domain-containing protein [Thermoanaerobaculia bacterium]